MSDADPSSAPGIDWEKNRRDVLQSVVSHYNNEIEDALAGLMAGGIAQADVTMELCNDGANRTVILVKGVPKYEISLVCKDATFTVTQTALA